MLYFPLFKPLHAQIVLCLIGSFKKDKKVNKMIFTLGVRRQP